MILKNISKFTSLTEEEELLFTSMLNFRAVPKKNMLRKGEIWRFEGYIQKGCERIYYVNEKRNEVTLSFAVEGRWVSDVGSFYENRPSDFFMETLGDTEMYVFTPQTTEKLRANIPKFERVFRLLMQQQLIRCPK